MFIVCKMFRRSLINLHDRKIFAGDLTLLLRSLFTFLIPFGDKRKNFDMKKINKMKQLARITNEFPFIRQRGHLICQIFMPQNHIFLLFCNLSDSSRVWSSIHILTDKQTSVRVRQQSMYTDLPDTLKSRSTMGLENSEGARGVSLSETKFNYVKISLNRKHTRLKTLRSEQKVSTFIVM